MRQAPARIKDDVLAASEPAVGLTAFERGLTVREAIARHGSPKGLTLTELSLHLGMHRSTVFRFPGVLSARGYIVRDPATAAYRLGAEVLLLAANWLGDLDVRREARPVLTELCERTQEFVHLAILDQGTVITIDRIEGRQPISLQTGIGSRRPAYCTAAGKAMLAFLPERDVDPLVKAELLAMTPATITSASVLKQQFEEIRRTRFAVEREEHSPGVSGVAAPVFDYDRRVVAAISVAAPTDRLPLPRLLAVGQETVIAAERVSRLPGYDGARMTRITTAERPGLYP